MEFIITTEITKFESFKVSDNSVDSIGDSHIEFKFNRINGRPYDLFFVTVSYDSDDISGGSISFEARAVISFQSGKPNVFGLIDQIKKSIDEINQLFKKEMKKIKMNQSGDIIYFKNKFNEENLLIELGVMTNEVYGV